MSLIRLIKFIRSNSKLIALLISVVSIILKRLIILNLLFFYHPRSLKTE